MEQHENDFWQIWQKMPPGLAHALNNKINNERVHSADRLHLLGLPAEIRNRIYTHALVSSDQSDPIEVDSTGPQQPGLLSCCRQIREEAVHIYYTLNWFAMVIHDCDAVAIQRPHDLIVKYCKTPSGQKDRGSVDFRGNPSWTNLVRWCKASHEDDHMLWMTVDSDETDKDTIAVATVLDVVDKCRQMGWDQSLSVLENMQTLMVSRNPAWKS